MQLVDVGVGVGVLWPVSVQEGLVMAVELFALTRLLQNEIMGRPHP